MKKALLIIAMAAAHAGFCKDANMVMTADARDANAQFEMGKHYEAGVDVEKDAVKAAQCYRRAAELGLAEAQFHLGNCYYYGKGVETNLTEAAKWHKKAAEQGFHLAQFAFASCCFNGDGVEKNICEAIEWFRKAAEQGFTVAQYALGDCYYYHFQDKQEALAWYRKAAEQGNPDAQYNVGMMYLRGEGVAGNRQEAIKWIGKAAEQGYKRAQDTLEELDDSYSVGQASELVGYLIGTVLFVYILWGIFLLLPRARKRKHSSVFPWWLMLLGLPSLVKEWGRLFDRFQGLVLLSIVVYVAIVFLHWRRCRQFKKQEANTDA